MDRNLLYNDLNNATDGKKHFIKVVKQTQERSIKEYCNTLELLKAEGKIVYEECRLYEDTYEPLIRMRGWIIQ